MLLITIFVELRVAAQRNQTRAGSPQTVCWWPCCAVAFRRTARSEHGMGMASVNQTWPHCVNQMGQTHSKPLAAWHGKGTAWAQHGHGMLCVNWPWGFMKVVIYVPLLSYSIWTLKIQVRLVIQQLDTTQLQLRLLQHYKKSMKRTYEDKSPLGYDNVLIRNKLPKFHSSIHLFIY